MRSNEQDNQNPGPVILDVEGLELNQRDQERISHPLTGGVILFGRNFTSRSQLIKLTNQIMAVRKDVLICIDHEGGRVQRCKTDGFTHLPAMRAFGELWSSGESSIEAAIEAMQAATACGYILASELRS